MRRTLKMITLDGFLLSSPEYFLKCDYHSNKGRSIHTTSIPKFYLNMVKIPKFQIQGNQNAQKLEAQDH